MQCDDDIQREERAIYLVAIVVLAPVVVLALVQRLSFDGGVTMCLATVVLGVIGLIATFLGRRDRLPPARARKSHPR
jgi:hypothetical protein